MDQRAVIRLGIDQGNIPQASAQVAKSLEQIGVAGQVSARQTAAAMRTLPAQFTDIATQLAGGQSIGLVLLQQGGQIKDSFGGVGNALRALGTLITPTKLLLGGLAAGIGTVVLAAREGAAQDKTLRDTIELTGNAAGLTAARLQALSESVSASSQQTVGGARDILVDLARSGQVSNKVLASSATAVARIADVTGSDATKVAADFATMAGGVADWAAEHNKAWNFITVEQYKYIKRLEDQGQAEKAMIVTNQAVTDHLAEQQKNLGYLEGAWDGVKKAASGAWDAMLNLGRAETTRQKLDDASRQLQQLPIAGANTGFRGIAQRRADLEQQIQLLKEQLKLEDQQADARSTNAAANRSAIAAERKADSKGAGRADHSRPYIPGEFQVLDARDGLVLQLRREKEASDAQGEFDKLLQASADRDKKRIDAQADFLQQLVDGNRRGNAELLEDERKRGEAVIEIDRDVAMRQLDILGFVGGARSQAIDEITEKALNARRKLEVDVRSKEDQAAARAGESLYGDVRDALSRAFQDSHNPAQAFAQGLGNAIFTRVTARLADALATAAVGSDGQGGFVGALLQGLGGMSVSPSSTGGSIWAGGAVLPGSLRGGGATGSNELERDMLTIVHKGEAIIPRKFNPYAPAGGGMWGGGAPTVNVTNHIDARTDQAQVAAIADNATRNAVRAVFEELDARGRLR